jgi:Transcription factor WhiB
VSKHQPPRAAAPPATPMPAALARGSCATHPHPEWWTGNGPEARAAASVCATCPVLTPCLHWAVTSLPATDPAIWGGTGPRERTRLRRARQTALSEVLASSPALRG